MRIVIADYDFPDHSIEEAMCAPYGFEIQEFSGRDPQSIIRNAAGADGIITSYGQFTREVFAALSPQLKVVSRSGVGMDSFDIAAATEFGVPVCNVPDYATEVVSDHAIMLALACLRRVVEQDANMRKGVWSYESTRPLGQCKGRTFGVVGMGAIGSAAARKAAALGFDVVCWSRSLQPGRSCQGVRAVELDELLAISDVVSVHTALTPDTRHLIDAAALARLKPGCVLVNTSRGAVVDTTALAQALEDGRLWGAGLDVFETEPIEPDHPILRAPHTVLTPHAAYFSEESGLELRQRTCQAVIDVLCGKRPRNCVNPQVLSD